MTSDKDEQQRILRNLKKTELLELLIEENNENERLYKLLQEHGIGDHPEEAEESPDALIGIPAETEDQPADGTAGEAAPAKGKGLPAWRNILSTENLKEELRPVAALAILIANFLVPAFQIYGNSMTPTLTEGEIVLALKGDDYEIGQLIAFYYNNKILVKRVIAGPGDWVDIDEDGNTYVNNQLLDEPYVSEKSLGDCNIEMPYQVPENRIFVMGDHRSVSVDSRNSSIGCISQEQIAGKLVFRVWPLPKFGGV